MSVLPCLYFSKLRIREGLKDSGRPERFRKA